MLDIIVEGFTGYSIGGSTSYNGMLCYGGGGANVAYYLAGLGAKPYLVSLIGDDFAGLAIKKHLEIHGVVFKGVIAKGLATGAVIALQHPWGERSFIVLPEPRGSISSLAVKLVDNLPQCTIFIHGYWLVREEVRRDIAGILDMARSRGCRIAFDPGAPNIARSYRNYVLNLLNAIDLLTPNWDEALELTGLRTTSDAREVALRLVEKGAKSVALKLGARGSILVSKDGLYAEAAAVKPSRLANSIGAGDAFDAVMVYGLSLGVLDEIVLREANRLSSKVLECTCAQCREAYRLAGQVGNSLRRRASTSQA